ncbi:hypothetical protein WBO78_11435 [Bosea sp. CCNWLW174]|uniref:hypothetical protein n=1 Tax=unclassified Bosea (in: a-proteobacteria) TaxID=2653178 RepID=UPI003014CFFE
MLLPSCGMGEKRSEGSPILIPVREISMTLTRRDMATALAASVGITALPRRASAVGAASSAIRLSAISPEVAGRDCGSGEERVADVLAKAHRGKLPR